MKEIESKAWLHTAEELSRVREYLQQNGRFRQQVRKHDIYFARPDAEHFDFRIRDENGTYTVTQKKRKVINGIEENDEFEFEVSDQEAFCQLMTNLGYVVFLEKIKHSEQYDLPNDILAEIIEIPELGKLLEVEKVCSEDEVSTAHKQIKSIFEELELVENLEPTEYSVLLRKDALNA